jgi:hypothetical protein
MVSNSSTDMDTTASLFAELTGAYRSYSGIPQTIRRLMGLGMIPPALNDLAKNSITQKE